MLAANVGACMRQQALTNEQMFACVRSMHLVSAHGMGSQHVFGCRDVLCVAKGAHRLHKLWVKLGCT